MGNGKLKEFIKRAIKVVPGLASAGTMLATGNILGAINAVKDTLQGASKDSPEAAEFLNEFDIRKEELELDAFRVEVEDRQGARELYKDDNLIQKVFAIAFLLGYSLLSWYLITILITNHDMPQLAETLITMIWTGTSTKLSTVVDFLFGGSMKN